MSAVAEISFSPERTGATQTRRLRLVSRGDLNLSGPGTRSAQAPVIPLFPSLEVPEYPVVGTELDVPVRWVDPRETATRSGRRLPRRPTPALAAPKAVRSPAAQKRVGLIDWYAPLVRNTVRGVVVGVLLLGGFLFGIFLGNLATPPVVDSGQTVTIAPGMTLWQVAQDLAGEQGDVGRALVQLKELNNISASELQVGDVLRLPR